MTRSVWSDTTEPANRRCYAAFPGIYEPTRGWAKRSPEELAPVFDLGSMDPDLRLREHHHSWATGTDPQTECSEKWMRSPNSQVGGTAFDAPLRTYSTGMRVRLAMGVVTSIDGNLLLDEHRRRGRRLPEEASPGCRIWSNVPGSWFRKPFPTSFWLDQHRNRDMD